MRRSTLRACFFLSSLVWLAGCPSPNEGTSSSSSSSGGPTQCVPAPVSVFSYAPKLLPVDLLLTIDNSRSMADKQAILALTIPDLVNGLVNPPCVMPDGALSPNQPAGPLDVCPDAGSDRYIQPVQDLHIGVITTSIGGHGADSCPNEDPDSKECAPLPNYTNNDHGRLVARKDACSLAPLPTYEGKGFLAWDPAGALSPPGESTLDDGMGKGLVPALRDMTIGVGQIGCGYESQLESIYRFLADPAPYESIAVQSGKATPMGIDQVLLDQRKAFLRPDSLLAVLLLSDENDCSIKEYSQFYYVGQLRNGATNVRLPRARQICEIDPFDECCKSCGQSDGSCAHDPTCDNPNGGPALLSPEEDDVNLRCWDQKRRFGIDFLYPTDRYVQAFTQNKIPDRSGNLVDNPIFSDLDPTDGHEFIRDSSLVLFAGIVGVPWQDIARDPADPKKGTKNAAELTDSLPNGLSTWDVILGDPATKKPPADPLMFESMKPRTGTNPILNEPLVNAGAPAENPINGHEWTIPNDDLQYACIFPLLPGTERDCSDPNQTACDCDDPQNDNPLCAPDPNNGGAPTKQVHAKAYPGLRQLAVLKNLGSQGIVGSVCPAQVTDLAPARKDFGYRPTIDAVLERLVDTADRQCPAAAPVDPQSGLASCVILEMTEGSIDGACSCDPAEGRIPVAPAHQCIANAMHVSDWSLSHPWASCICEIPQLDGAAGEACRTDASNAPMADGKPVNGFCYIDATANPPIGDPALVSYCPAAEARDFRFVGAAKPHFGGGLAIVCSNDGSP